MAATPTFEEAIGLTAEPIAVFDGDARLHLANPAFETAMRPIGGYLSRGTAWAMILSEAERKGLLGEGDAMALRMIEERYLDRPAAQPEVRVTRADGRVARAVLSRVSGDGFALSLREPEDRADTVAESQLEEIMSKVLQACPTCLTMSRIGDGRVLYRSPAAADLLGKGFNGLAHFAHRGERADFLTALLPAARVDDMRITARDADGETFPASISARLIDYRGEDVIVASIDDLSDRLAADAEIERQKKRLFLLEKMSALGEVLSGIAHELNNPLSVVVGNAHLLLEEEIDDGLRPRIEKITAAAERCVGIVRAFLSMARERPLDLETRSAADLLGSAADAFGASDRSDGVDLSISVASGLPDLLVDEIQVVQVFVNILSNAAQAMAEAGTGRRIAATAEPAPSGVRFRIADDGPGVPEDIRDRIFDPFFTTKDPGEGTGIGLALCHRIIAAHGGSMELEPPGRATGASFVVDLPCVPGGGDPAGA
ncbi:hybrid sensor histidine kinase/response regulator [Rhodobacterales bacterium HKCCE2091]|nr:hybrid sensor histidine kinase/response regulator [Rhodobacterales bacterium HKCCE2091]